VRAAGSDAPVLVLADVRNASIMCTCGRKGVCVWVRERERVHACVLACVRVFIGVCAESECAHLCVCVCVHACVSSSV
jgi:hypothetical protein